MYHNNTPKGTGTQIVPIYRSDGRVIGEVGGTVFQKHVRGSTHFPREPRSVGFDVSSLRDAERAGAETILVIDDETDTEYRTTFRHFWRKSFAVKRGYGDQRDASHRIQQASRTRTSTHAKTDSRCFVQSIGFDEVAL